MSRHASRDPPLTSSADRVQRTYLLLTLLQTLAEAEKKFNVEACIAALAALGDPQAIESIIACLSPDDCAVDLVDLIHRQRGIARSRK